MSTVSGRFRSERPRVLVVSIRRLNTHAAWCSNYEFEDVIADVGPADVLELDPAPRFSTWQHLSRSAAWWGRMPAFTRFNPGVRLAHVEQDYDLLVFVCMNVWDLLYLNALKGWKDRCKVKVCYLAELYGWEVNRVAHFLSLLKDFDHIFLANIFACDGVAKASGKPVHQMSLGVDALRFNPFSDPSPRVIDVLSIGRRAEPVHQELLRVSRDRGWFYLHDTVPGALTRPSNRNEHRNMLAAMARRSRYFVAYPAKIGEEANFQDSVVGARYFEGAASGAILLGQAPTTDVFRQHFPWPDPVLEVGLDGANLAERLAEMQRRPEEIARISQRNAIASLRSHDWAYRWQEMLAKTGVAADPKLARRMDLLESIARDAEHRDAGQAAS